MEKLVPQPQEAVAFGLLTREDAPSRSSTKSTSEPARNGTEAGSISTTAASRSITRSSEALSWSTSNLYWKPEQPPPSTEMRSMAPPPSLPRISPMRRAGRSLMVTAVVMLRLLQFPRHSYVRKALESNLSGDQYTVSVGMAAPRALYACDPDNSRGRLFQEPPSRTRSPFRRGCDRVIHSTAFRRLKHKTQVFVFHEGDHYRTRLTHSLEVAQIARALARQLGLDEDLTETLALAHDLGHPPFGHAGERALDACLQAHGGFDHNAQTLRVVTSLEHRYPDFDGLNLTWESLEGIVKHNGPLAGPDGTAVGRYRERGIPCGISDYTGTYDLELASFA